MKRTPMKRSGPIKSRRKARPKVNGIDYLAMCRGQPCYLNLFCCNYNPETVVPAHSNRQIHGKGMGIKASDEYTIPACYFCHAEIDQGKTMSKEQKFSAWDMAFGQWKRDRAKF